MTQVEITQSIKTVASEIGFQLCGITGTELPETMVEHFDGWLQQGKAGQMEYLTRDGLKRTRPDEVLPGAKSVICLGLSYAHPVEPRPNGSVGRVASYAHGRDYHKVIGKMLKQLCAQIQTLVPEVQLKPYVDTGPIWERAFAIQAGLGFGGKNTTLIHPQLGSYMFLACIITDHELIHDQPLSGSCGECKACLHACPTAAFPTAYEMDAQRCLSYQTIELKDDVPDEFVNAYNEWLYGCDICQQVCPYNQDVPNTPEQDFYPDAGVGAWIDLAEVIDIQDDTEYTNRFKGTPLMRPKRNGLQRSARLVSRGQDEALQ